MTPQQHELLDAARAGEVTWLHYFAGAEWKTAYFWTTQPRELRGVTARVRRMINNGMLKECRVLNMGESRGLVRPNDGTFPTGMGGSDD